MRVSDLWEQHRLAPFPRRLTSVDVAGVEMVTLDADIAGVVSGWLAGTPLDHRRWNLLADREQRLRRVLPELTGDEAAYYRRLLDMTVLVLTSPNR